MVFPHKCELPENIQSTTTAQGNPIELGSSYKYLGFLLDQELSFQPDGPQIEGEAHVLLSS